MILIYCNLIPILISAHLFIYLFISGDSLDGNYISNVKKWAILEITKRINSQHFFVEMEKGLRHRSCQINERKQNFRILIKFEFFLKVKKLK